MSCSGYVLIISPVFSSEAMLLKLSEVVSMAGESSWHLLKRGVAWVAQLCVALSPGKVAPHGCGVAKIVATLDDEYQLWGLCGGDKLGGLLSGVPGILSYQTKIKKTPSSRYFFETGNLRCAKLKQTRNIHNVQYNEMK